MYQSLIRISDDEKDLLLELLYANRNYVSDERLEILNGLIKKLIGR